MHYSYFRFRTSRVFNLEEAKKHLIQHYVTIKDQIQNFQAKAFLNIDWFNNRIELLQKISTQ